MIVLKKRCVFVDIFVKIYQHHNISQNLYTVYTIQYCKCKRIASVLIM